MNLILDIRNKLLKEKDETYCNFISATIKRTQTMYPNIIYNTGKRKRHAETRS